MKSFYLMQFHFYDIFGGAKSALILTLGKSIGERNVISELFTVSSRLVTLDGSRSSVVTVVKSLLVGLLARLPLSAKRCSVPIPLSAGFAVSDAL